MSRMGKKPVEVPSGVKVALSDGKVEVSGRRGSLSLEVPAGINVHVEGSRVVVDAAEETRGVAALHGLIRALIANMIRGVTEGFRKELELMGMGFKATVQGRNLVLNIGLSRPVVYTPPGGVSVAVEGGLIVVTGLDKVLVGNAAADIRRVFPAEPYKGKGIRYRGEHVRRKVGKTVA